MWMRALLTKGAKNSSAVTAGCYQEALTYPYSLLTMMLPMAWGSSFCLSTRGGFQLPGTDGRGRTVRRREAFRRPRTGPPGSLAPFHSTLAEWGKQGAEIDQPPTAFTGTDILRPSLGRDTHPPRR